MPKIKSPESFSPNQVLTAEDLQNHVDGSYPLAGFISEQSSIDSNSVSSSDELIIHDESESELRKIAIGDVFSGNLPIVTSLITGASGEDIVITPLSGGIVNVDGSISVSSNATIAGNFEVSGNVSMAGNLVVTGESELGPITVDGKVPMTVEDHFSKVYVKSSVATGTVADWNGSTAEKIVYQTPTLPDIPDDETWIFEFFANFTGGNGDYAGNTRPVFDYLKGLLYNNTTLLESQSYSCGVWGSTYTTMFFSVKLTSANNGSKLVLKCINRYNLWANPTYMVRMTKVKTSTLSDQDDYL